MTHRWGWGEPADGHGQPARSPEKPVPAERPPDCLEGSPPRARCSSSTLLRAHWDSVLSSQGSKTGSGSAAQATSPKDGGCGRLAICVLPPDWPPSGRWGHLSLAAQAAGTGGYMLPPAESLSQQRFM